MVERITKRAGGTRTRLMAMAVGAIGIIAAGTQGCSCGGDDGATAAGCGSDCKQVCNGPLPMGMIGSYTSLGVTKDGTIWVSGYNEAALGSEGNFLYGDLVVGKYDQAKGAVAWETVDGNYVRDDGSCPDNDRSGWRNGESESGDDVGLWTSLLLDDQDRPMVSYYDATHQALKFAYHEGGWSNFTIYAAPGADVGRYSKMLSVAGNPVIAFEILEKGTGGHVRSKLVIAKAQTPTPRSPSDFVLEDVAVDDSGPCRAFSCDSGQVCLKTGECQAPITGCTPADCGSGKACVSVNNAATCTAIIEKSYVEAYPSGIADYVSVVNGPQGLVLVAYDRIHGNLVGYQNGGSGWVPSILDGETGSRANNTAVDTGDVGVGASLAVTSNGDWHASYVDGINEALKYVAVPGGKTALPPEIVDDGFGLGVGAPPFPDGRHIVGDDSRIRVDDSGNVTILYQDATSGELKIATGAPTGQTHKWTVRVAAQPGRFGGFFPQFVPGQALVTNWWRALDHGTGDTSGDVALVPMP